MGSDEWKEGDPEGRSRKGDVDAEAKQRHLRDLCGGFIAVESEDERWKYAQAIGALVCPQVQADLEKVRRRIISNISTARRAAEGNREAIAGIRSFKATLAAKAVKDDSWEKVQLTPEICHDWTITGARVNEADVRELNRLLYWQVRLVKKEVRRAKRILDARYET